MTKVLMIVELVNNPGWVGEAVRLGAEEAGVSYHRQFELPVDDMVAGRGQPICIIGPAGTTLDTIASGLFRTADILLIRVDDSGEAMAYYPDPRGALVRGGPASQDSISRVIATWLATKALDLPDLRQEIERFCGWVERNLTANGSLESILDQVEQGPARRDRDLKQELVRTRAALDQTSRLVEALRAELLKDHPTAASTTIVARALGTSGGIAAGFAMGVLTTMTVAGVTDVGGALIVGAGGNALYDALRATLASVRQEAAARADVVVEAAEAAGH